MLIDVEFLLQTLQLAAVVGGGFYFVGRITKNLEMLTEGQKDHEGRIRSLEQAPSVASHSTLNPSAR